MFRAWLRRHSGTCISGEARNSRRRRFQDVDPLLKRLDRGSQVLDSRFETGETIAHDVTPLLTGRKLLNAFSSSARGLPATLLLLPDNNIVQRNNS